MISRRGLFAVIAGIASAVGLTAAKGKPKPVPTMWMPLGPDHERLLGTDHIAGVMYFSQTVYTDADCTIPLGTVVTFRPDGKVEPVFIPRN